MLINLNIALARTFVTVANCNNMTIAANKLHLTQGAVSQQIRRLEEVLQSNLFDRSQRKLKLTRRGEYFLDQAKRLLDLNDEIVSEMGAPVMNGAVRLGVPYDLVTSYLPVALRGFSDVNPKVDVSLFCEASPNLMASIDHQELDIAIIEEPIDNIQGECLCTERLLWVSSKRGSAHKKRPLPLSIVAETCVFRPAIHKALKRANIDWRTVFENGNLDATMTTVRADLAITASLASVVPRDLEIMTPDMGLPELPSFSISLYTRNHNKNVLITELARHIRSEFVKVNRTGH